MKKLYLIRHAKASWDHPEQTDFERTLTEQGKKDAAEIASQLKEKKLKPDIILSSTAERAIQTAAIFAKALGFPEKNILRDEHIYTGGVEDLVTMIKALSAKYKTVLIFGHNPSLTLVSHYLCEGLKTNLTTSGVVGIGFKMDRWEEVVETEGEFIQYLHPHHDLHEVIEPKHEY